MKTGLVLALTLLFPPLLGQATAPEPPPPGALSAVIAQVTKALDEYQDNRGSGDIALPPLSSAEFNFKTTTAKSSGITVTLLIFQFGSSQETAVVNDVTFTYSPPAPPQTKSLRRVEPPPLKDELAKAIQSAAMAVKGSPVAAHLPFSKLTVILQYGVKWEKKGGAEATYSFVTLGLGAAKNTNAIQSVKLVFGT